MKILTFVILCFASVAFAEDFKAIDGKEYKNVKVSRVEPDGIVVTFSGGIVKIPFIELPPEIQKKYGYDPKASAAFQQQTYQADVVRARQQAEATEKRRQEFVAAKQAQAAAPPVQRQSITESMHGSMLDQRPVETTLFYGRIIQTVDEGLLVSVLVPAYSGQGVIPAGTIILLVGNFPRFYDDDRIQVTGTLVGTHNYTAVWNYKRTVRAYKVRQISKLN
jgi:hypothetical protein